MSASKLRSAFFSRRALGSRVLEMSAGVIGRICASSSVMRNSNARFLSVAQLQSLIARNPNLLISSDMAGAGLATLLASSELTAQNASELPTEIAAQAYSNLQYFLTHASSTIRCLIEKNIMGNQLRRTYN